METFGSMEKKEKVEFILDQMRLCLAKKDYIRTQIISKKVSSKFFDSTDEEVQVMLSNPHSAYKHFMYTFHFSFWRMNFMVEWWRSF